MIVTMLSGVIRDERVRSKRRGALREQVRETSRLVANMTPPPASALTRRKSRRVRACGLEDLRS